MSHLSAGFHFGVGLLERIIQVGIFLHAFALSWILLVKLEEDHRAASSSFAEPGLGFDLSAKAQKVP